MPKLTLRPMTLDDHPDVASLIFQSTNAWYRRNRGQDIFQCDPKDTIVFCQVYEALDPGQAVVIEEPSTGHLAGSCFIHPRKTHISLGILNTAPQYAGQGVARTLVQHVTNLADKLRLPTRLISSAMNLDSYSLYNRTGFVPTGFFQDMLITVPDQGLLPLTSPPFKGIIRDATPADIDAIDALERRVTGISRPDDWAYFIQNDLDIWKLFVAEDTTGQITGTLGSIAHPASSMIGPGLMDDDTTAIAMLHAQFTARRGKTLVAVIPADRPAIAQMMYAWGARNCETHITQCRGQSQPVRGIAMPTFLPETG